MKQTALIIRLDADLHREFKAYCKSRKKTMAKTVRRWIRKRVTDGKYSDNSTPVPLDNPLRTARL